MRCRDFGKNHDTDSRKDDYMRHPNGYGCVTKLSGKRRKPFVARITAGHNSKGNQIYSVIGYYPTRKEALTALAQYNAQPYDIELSKITLKDLFEIWSATELPKLGESLQYSHRAAYKYCKHLENIPYRNLRKAQMQDCIDRCGKSESTQTNIANLFRTLDRYAYDQDIIVKQYSANLTTSTTEKKKRNPFSKDEIKSIEAHAGQPLYDETLFMLYTGCRVSEMLLVRSKDIDLYNRTLTLGVKTDAGRNRIIPIHHKLEPIIKAHIGAEHLFAMPRSTTAKNPDKALQTKFLKDWQALFPDHDTHDCRHTFRSQLDRQEANRACVNLIMGHKGSDVGERVYTHKTIQELIGTIDLLDFSV